MFPTTIESKRFGTLRLEQFSLSDQSMHRHYEPTDRVKIRARGVQIDPKGLTLVIWPPKTGIPDVASFTATAEQQFDAMIDQLDRILGEAVPVIRSAIDSFWQIPDEPAPTPKELLDTGLLRQVNLSAAAGTHILIIFDEGDLIGGRDLLLTLTKDLRPHSAHFDG